MLDVLGLIGILAVCAGLLFAASRIEPHWISKDGNRFLTMAQELDQWGLPAGRRHEVRVNLDPDEPLLHVSRRSFTRPTSGLWRITAKAPSPPRGRQVYFLKRLDDGAAAPADSRRGGGASFASRLLRPAGPDAAGGHRPSTGDVEAGQLALRLPAKSKVVPVLDELLARASSGSDD